MLISGSLQKWCESLASDLKDLHVSDLSVCDQLIAAEVLSEDDWEVLRKTKRGKSKIKRLIKILSKRDDPKAAFTTLAKCIALHHEHLSATVQAALDRFPEVCINCAGYRQGVEHNEGVSEIEIRESFPGDGHRVPVQHDESASIDLSRGKINDANSDILRNTPVENEVSDSLQGDDNLPQIAGFQEQNEDILSADIENCDHSNVNENKDSEFTQPSSALENCKDNFSILDFKSLQTDILELQNNDFRISNKKKIDSNYTDFENKVRIDTRDLVDFNSDTTEANDANDPLSRLESKRLKHLLHHPLTISKLKEEKQVKVNVANITFNTNYSLDADKACNTLRDITHPSGSNDIDKVTLSTSYGSNDYQPDGHDGDCLGYVDARSKYVTGAESQYFVPNRHELCVNKFPVQSKPCQYEHGSMNIRNSVREHTIPCKTTIQRQNVDTCIVRFAQPHPRALSQIGNIPAFTVDKSNDRTKSWTGPQTRSHVYDGFSSSSEDYTTTDMNYSDLNEVERELCDNLEQSGSITDIIDRLIQEEYLSNDDWSAINDIKVKRNQATYVAKRISNKIREEGSQNFSNILKSQPGLCKWLASKFREPVENVHLTETPLGKDYKHEQKFSGQGVDQIDGTMISPDNSSQESGDYSVIALCGHASESEIAFPCPENICSAGITVDKHFQTVFDTLNTEFNKGTLPVTHLPSEPNVKCIVLYLKACDALYKTQTEDAERYIKLAEAAVNDTDCPAFMKGEIFTQKTWLCLCTNRLGMMERLLEEHEQFLLAHPNVWSHKATGWFYYDYGRFYVRMMSVTKPSRHQRQTHFPDKSKAAYCVYKEKAIMCLRKSADYFAHSDSSDGPLGMGYAICLLASVELGCVTEFDYLNRGLVIENYVTEAATLLQTVLNLYDELPDILKTSYLLSNSDLCFRRNEFGRAKELVSESAVLCDSLCLQDDLKECKKRLRLLNQFV